MSSSNILTDDELRQELIKNGVDVGPITSTTRKVYIKRLEKLKFKTPVSLCVF